MSTHTRTRLSAVSSAVVVSLGISLVLPLAVLGSSHREAPLISTDPRADNTDVYAFVSPDKPDTVTLIASFHPFQEPAGGPNFYGFGDDVLYEIKVDNNGDASEDISYQFRFKTTVQNGNTFLYNTGTIDSLTDPDFNVRQTYTLTKVEGGVSTVLGTDLPVPPVNVGPKSTPNYAALSDAAIKKMGDGTSVFAGQTDDPFFVELGGIFDLVNVRKLPGNAGAGVDGLAGYNVNSIALQIPTTLLTKTKSVPAASDGDAVIGVWSTTSRQATRVLATDGTVTNSGDWVQVSRLGAPLVNEVVIPRVKKDVWNGSKPADDAQFANFVTNPELGGIMKALFNIQVPPQGDFGSTDQRDDLIAIFLTGIKGLTQPNNVKPSEQLRLNVAVAPSSSPNALGVVGGDNAGYPNGRRLADDVTDISLKAVAGGAYPLFHPDFTPDAVGVQLGDGVDRNDVSFRSSFPYLAVAHQGFESVPHTGAAKDPVCETCEVMEEEEEEYVDLPFDDVTEDNDYESIAFLKELGIVSGSNGWFRPLDQINRAEFTKMVMLSVFEESEIRGSACFADVSGWFEKYVCMAKAHGIVSGYADGHFKPDAKITVEEAYKIVSEVFFQPTGPASSPWYAKYLTIAEDEGFALNGISVGSLITREQMATILASVLE